MRYAWFVSLPIEFPEGVHLGAGKQFNALRIARDGTGQPVLHGTSLAGCLRSIWRSHLLSANREDLQGDHSPAKLQRAVEAIFGRANDDQAAGSPSNNATTDQPSLIKFSNYPLVTASGEAASTRPPKVAEFTYHQRNRHRGHVLDGGLFSVESCPPGTAVRVGFWIVDSGSPAEVDQSTVEEFLGVIYSAFSRGIHLGGNSNRGFGRAVIREGEAAYRRFDMTELSDHSAQLDAHRAWRMGETVPCDVPLSECSKGPSKPTQFAIDVVLEIPRGEDILIGAGSGEDVGMGPQRVQRKGGDWCWRLPGSSLRGLFRAWMHRLATRERIKVARDTKSPPTDLPSFDTVEAFEELEQGKQGEGYYGEHLAWCGQPTSAREHFVVPAAWTIVSLFGSGFGRGRIKISDGYAPCSASEIQECTEAQRRVHVAVDRVTGGAAEGYLFDNRVLIPLSEALRFQVRIQITDAKEFETRWLAQTLIALHTGLLRVGSSKASGRMRINEIRHVCGVGAAGFDETFEKAQMGFLIQGKRK